MIKKVNKSFSFFIPISIILSFACGILVGHNIFVQIIPNTIPTPTQIPTIAYLDRPYLYTQYGDEKFFKEIFSFNRDQLVGMKCTPSFFDMPYGPSHELFYLESPSPKISDEEINSIISIHERYRLMQKIKEINPNEYINSVQFCITEKLNPKYIIVVYGLSSEGINSSKINFGLGELRYGEKAGYDDRFKKITSIQNSDGSYGFGCDKPLLLTKNNLLYYECLSHIGGYISNYDIVSYFYSINLSSGEQKLHYRCQNNNPKDSVNCKKL